MQDRGGADRHRIWGWVQGLETALLALLLFLMLGLGCAQILLRNLADTGLPWIDPLLRASVLWLGLLGAMAAARELRHIRVDALQRWLPDRAHAFLDAVTAAATAVVCSFIAWHGGRMVLDEIAYGTGGGALIAPWLLQTVIPVAFGVIALSYAVHAVLALRSLLVGAKP